MLLKYTPFQEYLNRNVAGSFDQSKVVTAAIALAVSRAAALPSGDLEDPDAYFAMQCLPAFNQQISEFNENIIFDLRACLEQARTFWNLRFYAAYPVNKTLYANGESFFDCLSGVNLLVPKETQTFLDTYKAWVFPLSIIAFDIITQIQE